MERKGTATDGEVEEKNLRHRVKEASTPRISSSVEVLGDMFSLAHPYVLATSIVLQDDTLGLSPGGAT